MQLKEFSTPLNVAIISKIWTKYSYLHNIMFINQSPNEHPFRSNIPIEIRIMKIYQNPQYIIYTENELNLFLGGVHTYACGIGHRSHTIVSVGFRSLINQNRMHSTFLKFDNWFLYLFSKLISTHTHTSRLMLLPNIRICSISTF